MFNQTFYNKVERILARFNDTGEVSHALLGNGLAELKHCLAQAEVDDAVQAQFMDVLLDRVADGPRLRGPQLAIVIRGLLRELPGLSGRNEEANWTSAMPVAPSDLRAERRWDIKELDNRLSGSNRASAERLRRLLGLMSERRIHGAVDLRHRQRFETCGSMKMGDRHDAGIDGEQINRLIRYLGRGNGGPGGRPAVLG